MESALSFGDGLRATLGQPRDPRLLDSSPRSRVWRVELAAGPAVVKQVVGGADADERYAREVAALELAATADAPVVPAVWGTDPGERVLVMAYVPHRRPTAGWIVAYARALAALHASGGPEVVDALPRWRGPDDADVDSFLALADTLGARAAPGVAAELRALTRRLATAPGRALLHGDPCPGNDLHTADGVTFIDLEGASWGSGLVELAYLRVGFPTCWCVTSASPALLERAERAYAATWRARTGTDLRLDLADACAGWLIRGDALVERAHRGTVDQLARLPHEDWTWGTVSARERLAHRLAVVAELTRGRAESSGLAALCVELRDRMLAHWPTLRPAPTHRP
ncbi:aminoglycoside phosphotransferase family protein [Streptomyces sp. 71268]|uniref:aminoglycoside phosphotransferase family protein n=1 Tax=Streptomyces sp. 71268 TaxID=3002640 RepID=UPI0023F89EF1|nr:aminoglycoside phosphotransferase family protein [Streptomyces sp. 71268]WEV28376.1 aminoglycoside phosphotransferase family protein [Streptomyces sp. 71268]